MAGNLSYDDDDASCPGNKRLSVAAHEEVESAAVPVVSAAAVTGPGASGNSVATGFSCVYASACAEGWRGGSGDSVSPGIAPAAFPAAFPAAVASLATVLDSYQTVASRAISHGISRAVFHPVSPEIFPAAFHPVTVREVSHASYHEAVDLLPSFHASPVFSPFSPAGFSPAELSPVAPFPVVPSPAAPSPAAPFLVAPSPVAPFPAAPSLVVPFRVVLFRVVSCLAVLFLVVLAVVVLSPENVRLLFH